jgi:hypothetical protein
MFSSVYAFWSSRNCEIGCILRVRDNVKLTACILELSV